MRGQICTEASFDKVDGVTRTLGRLLEHLEREGHTAIVLGSQSKITHHHGHELIGSRGIPFVFYPGVTLSFFRPLFIRKLLEFKPDVVHICDPIWLGAQTIFLMRYFLPDTVMIASYHTNIATLVPLLL